MRLEGCNYTTAVNKALAREEGRVVFGDVRRAEKTASGFSYADLECHDRIDAQRDSYSAI
jgi:hypothetical protein